MSTAPIIYLDHAATTPMDPRVLAAMMPFFLVEYGNAASRQHALGQRAARAVEHARAQVAALLGADPREIIFTSGATEANNMALKGVAGAPAYARGPRHFVTAMTEHNAVLDPLATLERESAHGAPARVTRLRVDAAGGIDLRELEGLLEKGVQLVSLMHGNNEVGCLHPVAEIGALCRKYGALFHTDATQTAGKVEIDVDALSIDLLSLSAHKFYGPKGVGALFLRRRRPRVRCVALLDGGGHERALRSGTLNVPGIVGFGAAAGIAARELGEEKRRIVGLRVRLEEALMNGTNGVTLNCAAPERLAGITNLSFEGAESESLLMRLERVAASSSSACTSATRQPSHVLRALGLSEERIAGSLRFSLGRSTTAEDVDAGAAEVLGAVAREREEGPLDLCAGGAESQISDSPAE